MTVGELIQKLSTLPAQSVVVKQTSDGYFLVRDAELNTFNIWESGTIHKEYFPDLEPEPGETRVQMVEL
jgi:hypothetical protein